MNTFCIIYKYSKRHKLIRDDKYYYSATDTKYYEENRGSPAFNILYNYMYI